MSPGNLPARTARRWRVWASRFSSGGRAARVWAREARWASTSVRAIPPSSNCFSTNASSVFLRREDLPRRLQLPAQGSLLEGRGHDVGRQGEAGALELETLEVDLRLQRLQPAACPPEQVEGVRDVHRGVVQGERVDLEVRLPERSPRRLLPGRRSRSRRRLGGVPRRGHGEFPARAARWPRRRPASDCSRALRGSIDPAPGSGTAPTIGREFPRRGRSVASSRRSPARRPSPPATPPPCRKRPRGRRAGGNRVRPRSRRVAAGASAAATSAASERARCLASRSFKRVHLYVWGEPRNVRHIGC